MSAPTPIRPRERDAILQALGSGVVPRTGQQHIQVGRAGELTALVHDVERIADGGAAIRLVIGEYGAGKTFFLNLVRAIALESKLVTAHADLNPDRRLHASGGQARALYQELTANLATRSRPDGNAMPSVIERFVTTARSEAAEQGRAPSTVIAHRLERLSETSAATTSRSSSARTGAATTPATSGSGTTRSAGCAASSAPAPRRGPRSASARSSTTPRSTTT